MKRSWVITLCFLALAGGLLIWRAQEDPVCRAAEDLLRSINGTKALPGTIRIDNGSLGRLSREQASGVIKHIVRPSFAGWRVEEIKQVKASTDSAGAVATISRRGSRRKILLAGGPSSEGAVFRLDSLLRMSWASAERLGSRPDWLQIAPAYLNGVRRDRSKLERLGIPGLDFGRQGVKSWDELEAWFARNP